jgi:nucleotide-binding universal stress UspA family protein
MTTTAGREATEFRPEGGVVVGDDGSACAVIAMRAGAEEAVRRGAMLHVLRAWSITSAARPADVPAGIVPSMKEFEAATLVEEESRAEEVLRDCGVSVEVHVVHTGAVKALLRASETADLLVVGSRGGGGFQQLVLGSVAEQCVRHAKCSVLVVRG